MNSGGGNQSGTVGGQSEEAEDDESSSTSTIVEDELENFRQQWKREVTAGCGPNTSSSKIGQGANFEVPIEEKARQLFLEGVEHERKGELFEAIQKYRKAVLLVPDIEVKTFEHNLGRRRSDIQNEETVEVDDGASEADAVEIPHDDVDEAVVENDLVGQFSRLKTKCQPLCEPDNLSAVASTSGHISILPVELMTYILRWVVSSDLDLKSLENFSRVCRGFYVLARDPEIWRRVCVQTWGLTGVPIEEPACWRQLFLSRDRVNLNGCYISKASYLREGERGFQDNEFYRSWHVVQYYRLIRFFAGGRVVMMTTSEEPSVAVKMINNKLSWASNGCLFGHYRTVNNRVVCVGKKLKPPQKKANPRFATNRKRQQNNSYAFEVPEQDFHFEFEIKGKKKRQLHWLCYSVISKYRNGDEQWADIDVSNISNYPVLHFSRVESYTNEALRPLR